MTMKISWKFKKTSKGWVAVVKICSKIVKKRSKTAFSMPVSLSLSLELFTSRLIRKTHFVCPGITVELHCATISTILVGRICQAMKHGLHGHHGQQVQHENETQEMRPDTMSICVEMLKDLESQKTRKTKMNRDRLDQSLEVFHLCTAVSKRIRSKWRVTLLWGTVAPRSKRMEQNPCSRRKG